MMRRISAWSLGTLLLLPAACAAAPEQQVPAASFSGAAETGPNWKERLAERYVYLEHRGDYRKSGSTMRELLRLARESGLRASGPPFALFYDDPGLVALGDLRSRLCLPLSDVGPAPSGLAMDVLPQATVAYEFIRGSYSAVPRAYPGLLAYLGEHGWRQRGPIRVIYWVNPGSAPSLEELVAEVQVAWAPASDVNAAIQASSPG
jgi:effector-binding domain-containing protein